MDDANTGPAFDRRRIRIGLVMVVVVVVLALGLAVVVSSPLLKVFFGGIVVVAVLQTWRLRRIVRSERAP